jgi:hypothetical protein
MPRTVAELPCGSRIADYISLGVLAKTFPSRKVQKILKESGRRASGNAICLHMWSSTT